MSTVNGPFMLKTGRKTITLHPIRYRSISVSSRAPHPARFRSNDFSRGYTGEYEPGLPTGGPLDGAAKHGAPKLTPSLLKEHLDKFVVGQDKAKKVTSVAIYNHYQRIREIKRQDAEEHERQEQKARRLLHEKERNSHPVENEYPGHVETVDLNARREEEETELGSVPLRDDDTVIIEKSNLMLLGPSGVGKTYILQTLAKILEVPFAMVDCSSLTQAGYIGTDIESSIERLLLAASYSIPKTESGIIFFDEVDKLAKPAIMTHGRDVSGEGVQQGLLKMIEGTTVTVNVKADRNISNYGKSSGERGGPGRSDVGAAGAGQMVRTDQYSIDTSNILFVFAGAFVGLEKIINTRLSRGSSIGFGAQLRNSTSTSNPPNDLNESQAIPDEAASTKKFSNPLQHVTPTDLQTYGLIPELLGRIPIITSLAPLTLQQLVSILTEPKNSLVKQYTALFATYGIQLRFSTLALEAIALRTMHGNSALARKDTPKGSTTAGSSTQPGDKEHEVQGIGGARGLRAVMEDVLSEVMFWGPGSGIRYVMVGEDFVKNQHHEHNTKDGKAHMPLCFSRGQQNAFNQAWEKEEETWRQRKRGRGPREIDEIPTGQELGSFEKMRGVGSSGM
ncbi:P-loop containing nucleoside triphosphate hydrolase protein [Xylogone sp. PMI_703]|nr:P-loop containing nucleoside triphosphate hydrolase protein [Xylogone sp. PMI_703]